MRMDERFYNIFIYLYNKNILEYGQIARNGTESGIPDTEGRSNIYVIFLVNTKNSKRGQRKKVENFQILGM